MSERLDVAIVGAGPAGLAAGAQAARRGLRHAVLDSSRLANTVFRYQKRKLVMSEPARLPLHEGLGLRFGSGSREDVLAAWEEGTRAAGTDLRAGPGYEVTRIEGEKGRFALSLRNGETLACDRVVLAIGVQGNLRTFGVPGEDLPHVVYQLDDPAEHADRRIVVVGAGDAGIENALALAEHDNQVSLVNLTDEFPRAREANRKAIERAIAERRITHFANTQVERFEPACVLLGTPDGQVRLDADLVIGRLGAVAPRGFLQAIGIAFPSDGPGAVPEVSGEYESNVPGVHIVGALAGYPLIKQCMNQGFEVIEHILGNAVTPADEPLLREKFAGLGGTVDEILERIRSTITVFSHLTTIQLREFLVDSTVHRPRPGQVVFERNDFSTSFHSILEGGVDVVLPAADRDRDRDREVARGEARSASVRLERGDFFGELSLISGRRRSATVKAGRDCVLVETPRLAMTRLMHSSDFVRRTLDAVFITRTLARLAPLASAEARAELAAAGELRCYRPGEALWEQDDPFDGIYLIRRGSVTVARRHSGGETVVNYVQAGNFVGQSGAVAAVARRSAAVRAAVYTETVRLPAEAVARFLGQAPEIRRQFESQAMLHVRENVVQTGDHRSGDLVGFLIATGAGEATDLLLLNEALCVHCDNCEKACAETHGGVSRLARRAGPTFARIKVPTSCRHCENPKCMTECPPDAIRRHPSGEVYIMDNCIGCGACAANCPYSVIQMAELRPEPRRSLLLDLLFGRRDPAPGPAAAGGGTHKTAVKCDLCRELPVAKGRTRNSACVASCPTGAIVRVDPRAYISDVLQQRGAAAGAGDGRP